METEGLLEQVRWPACLQQPWSFHLRSSGFYIPAMHHRSHYTEEVLHRSVCIGSYSPAILKVESGDVEELFREPLEERGVY